MKYLVEPRQLSRFYGLKDAGALRLAAVVAPLAILITYLCLLPVGAVARTLIPLVAIDGNTDVIVPYLLGEGQLLGPIMSTLFLLVLVSAAMSSIDSVLLVAASTIDRDLFLNGERRRGSALWRTRMWVVVVSVAAAVAALIPSMRNIVEVTAFSGSLYGACFLPVLVVGLFLRRRSASAAIVTMVIGAICVIVAFTLKKLGYSPVHEVYPGMATGLTVYLYMSSADRSTT